MQITKDDFVGAAEKHLSGAVGTIIDKTDYRKSKPLNKVRFKVQFDEPIGPARIMTEWFYERDFKVLAN